MYYILIFFKILCCVYIVFFFFLFYYNYFKFYIFNNNINIIKYILIKFILILFHIFLFIFFFILLDYELNLMYIISYADTNEESIINKEELTLNSEEITTNDNEQQVVKKNAKFFKYLYIFSFVFCIGLFIFFLIKSGNMEPNVIENEINNVQQQTTTTQTNNIPQSQSQIHSQINDIAQNIIQKNPQTFQESFNSMLNLRDKVLNNEPLTPQEEKLASLLFDWYKKK